MDRKNSGGYKSPERLGDYLGSFVSGTGKLQQRMGELFQLKRLWCKLMGDRIAVISSPYRIKDAVLYVSVHDAMWIAELPYIKADMLAKLAEAGLALVDIKFTLSKVPPPKVALAPAKRAIPAEQQLWAERVSKMITDEAIRESYLKAVLASLERG